MDYALQFYRHLVEQHGTTPEAQEAREGLFRIAEWRWGEARVARGRDAAGGGAQSTQSAPSSQTPPAAPAGNPPGGQRVYNVANNPPQLRLLSGSTADSRRPRQAAADHRAAGTTRMTQAFTVRASVIAQVRRPRAERHRLDDAARRNRRGNGRLRRFGRLNSSAIGPLGAPFGILIGLPALLLGVCARRRRPACRGGVREHQRQPRARRHRARSHQLLSRRPSRASLSGAA